MDDTSPDTELDSVEKQRQGSVEVSARKTLSGGHDPREMALRAQASRRAKTEASEAPSAPGDVRRMVRVPVNQSRILRKLESLAAQGDTSAARELRSWLHELPIEAETTITDLDRSTRQRLLARLLEEDAAAQAQASEGSAES